MSEAEDDKRARARELAAEYAVRGDLTGWFEALYAEAGGDNEKIPWADLKPNRYLRKWAGRTNLKGHGRKALVVGCGLGDDAAFLDDLGFSVTAFDLSPTAIEWAKRLHVGRDIQFEVCDLFQPFRGWLGSFDFVLEVYTIQPLPMELRPSAIDAIAAFVAEGGTLVVVARYRDDDEEPLEMPWPLSRQDLSRFRSNGLEEIYFEKFFDETDDPVVPRFVAQFQRSA